MNARSLARRLVLSVLAVVAAIGITRFLVLAAFEAVDRSSLTAIAWAVVATTVAGVGCAIAIASRARTPSRSFARAPQLLGTALLSSQAIASVLSIAIVETSMRMVGAELVGLGAALVGRAVLPQLGSSIGRSGASPRRGSTHGRAGRGSPTSSATPGWACSG
jgi:hypothetical protein